MAESTIHVSISLDGIDHTVGTLWCRHRKGRESASFEYDKSWLENPEKFSLEPALQLVQGSMHTAEKQKLFGAIGDSAPDRWGRLLMMRAEARKSRESGEVEKTLNESDFLLRVSDETRQGALRFSLTPGGVFLREAGLSPVPPLIELPTLLNVTEKYLEEREDAAELRMLLAPGSSLGGARPKASIRDTNGALSIAKFPKKMTHIMSLFGEAVALTLAAKAGIRTAEWRLENILDKPVLVLKRFDRNGDIRIPFLSAMSMVGGVDNEEHSYLELSDALQMHGASPDADRVELWRRIVFTIMISNVDDHLRNHGFMYERSRGWRLSPAYDMNPTPKSEKARFLSTSITETDNAASLDLALKVIDRFNIKEKTAKLIIKEVAEATAQWHEVAIRLGLNNGEIKRMETAFEHEDMEKAKSF
ncbi:MAG: type II toxin-antitoxin system HipA family toxin [Micavibrio sp.]|nr:type II toxin-antitoxin system HipA family toxin [Micavibrio sp.]